jgi:hypothetical protein
MCVAAPEQGLRGSKTDGKINILNGEKYIFCIQIF